MVSFIHNIYHKPDPIGQTLITLCILKIVTQLNERQIWRHHHSYTALQKLKITNATLTLLLVTMY